MLAVNIKNTIFFLSLQMLAFVYIQPSQEEKLPDHLVLPVYFVYLLVNFEYQID